MTGQIGGFTAQDGIYRKLEETLKNRAQTQGAGPAGGKEKEVAEEFAALLFYEVIKAMRATIPRGGLVEEDALQRDIYTSMADMEIARSVAKNERAGLRSFVANMMLGQTPKGSGGEFSIKEKSGTADSTDEVL